jgi:hypothetical protein
VADGDLYLYLLSSAYEADALTDSTAAPLKAQSVATWDEVVYEAVAVAVRCTSQDAAIRSEAIYSDAAERETAPVHRANSSAPKLWDSTDRIVQ